MWLLWARIRGRGLGPVFRWQVPLLRRFIADFLAPAERLVIEVDGGHHVGQACADTRRDAVLTRAGYRVLRLDAALVMIDIEAASPEYARPSNRDRRSHKQSEKIRGIRVAAVWELDALQKNSEVGRRPTVLRAATNR